MVLYRLSGTIELDNAFVGGKQKGKRGRGAEGKTLIIVACENRTKKAGVIAIKTVDSITFSNVEAFVQKHLLVNQEVRTNAYRALNIINNTQSHIPKITPNESVDEWLPWVHIAIGNLMAFLLGTFHGVTNGYLQECLDEFCYRFNRRFVEKEILNRLLNLAIIHASIKTT